MTGSRATAATATPPSAELRGSGRARTARDGADGPARPASSPQVGRLAVAYSGGRDSTALLHAAAQAARGHGLAVHALHVHHGLSRHADDWLAHCQQQCRRWAAAGLPVSLHAARLALHAVPGESLEALARRARYGALRRLALEQGCGLVLLAHHRRDQAETFLLQALRGAGVAGLAGMPAEAEREGLVWARPWLARPREAIEAYVRVHRLRYIDDDSNAEPRFARNRLRLAVWPALARAFPEAEAVLADASVWAAQAHACAADLAALDLAGCAEGGVLDLVAWQALAPHRAANALRAWLRGCAGQAAGAAEVERLLRELPASRAPARWQLKAGGLRRYRGQLRWEPARPGTDGVARDAAGPEASLSLRRAGRYALPGWGGVLVASRVRAGGVALARLTRLGLAARGGGEQFQAAPGRPPRSLKKQFQAAALPAWARGGPLLFDGEQLVFVPGLGIDARVLAAPGEPQLLLRWEPAGAAAAAR